MGCDIHAVFQKRTPEGWEDVPTKWDEGRHYFLFSVLAGVRNGYGFAGVPTYVPLKPISEPRGLPSDFVVDHESHPLAQPELLGWRAKYRDDAEPLEVWMGDHSHSWLTADEILAYATSGGDDAVERTGVLSLEAYRKWDKVSQPPAWCGGVSGNGILISLPSEINERTSHVRVTWIRSQLDEIGYFISEVQRLKDEHGDVRMVFGFDS